MKVGLITNPVSRRGLGEADGLLAKWFLSKRGIDVVDLTGNSAQNSLAKLRNALAEEKLDAVLAVGGDGTLHIGVEGLTSTGIPLGVVASGTGNDVARHFGVELLDVESNINRFLDVLSQGNTRSIDVMQVGERRAIAVVSAGVDAEINRLTNAYRWPRGSGRYLRGIVSGLAHHRPYGLRLEVDGKLAQGSSTLISVANTSFFGAGLQIAPEASATDGLLDVIVVRGLNRMEIVKLFAGLSRGTHLNHSIVHHIRAKNIRISAAPEYGSAPPEAMADGDIMGSLPLKISCLPGALELAI